MRRTKPGRAISGWGMLGSAALFAILSVGQARADALPPDSDEGKCQRKALGDSCEGGSCQNGTCAYADKTNWSPDSGLPPPGATRACLKCEATPADAAAAATDSGTDAAVGNKDKDGSGCSVAHSGSYALPWLSLLLGAVLVRRRRSRARSSAGPARGKRKGRGQTLGCAALFALLSVGSARADLLPPDESDCRTKHAGDSCTDPSCAGASCANSTCQNATCVSAGSDNANSDSAVRPPPAARSCLKCAATPIATDAAAAATDSGTDAAVGNKDKDGSGCSVGDRGSSALPWLPLLLGAVLVRRRHSRAGAAKR